MNLFLSLFLLFLASCATKHIIPGNRFITPESQGGLLNGEFEIQQSSANQLLMDLADYTLDNGVIYEKISRSGFALSSSLVEQFDLIWSHTGNANSMVGGKFQLLGASRSAKGAGHKLSFTALMGANEHESDSKDLEFKLSGRDILITYGYRLTESIMPYVGLSMAKYEFEGLLRSSDNSLDGAKPYYLSDVKTLYVGGDFAMNAIFGKVELAYQQIATTDTEDKTQAHFGFSFGYRW